MSREPFAVDVQLALQPGADPRAPGGEVTVELCDLADRLAGS
jgi:hypothetical protein